MKYKAKILVVDDDIPVCKSISSALEQEGYTVEMAHSGEEGIEMEKARDYAIMLVDLMMPGMDGMQLVEKVKQKNPDITAIMITGYPSLKTAVQSIKSGAFDYIPKPFTKNDLLSLISRALERRHIYEETVSKMGLTERKLVELSLPADLYCIPENAWAKVEKDGGVRVGIHHILSRTIKNVQSIEFPIPDESISQGEACLVITDSQGYTHRVWMPVSGKILSINEKIRNDHSKIIEDPYEEGWLFMIEPIHLEDDLKNLSPLS